MLHYNCYFYEIISQNLWEHKVVRYTALLSGVFYGISHRRTLQKAHDEDKQHHAIHEREHLIAQAKEAWKKKQETSKDSSEFLP